MAKSDIDRHVGARVRVRRKDLGMSQGELGLAAGVSAGEIQGFEDATSRIGVTILFAFANALNVDIGYFFQGLPLKIAMAQAGLAETPQSDYQAEPPRSAEVIRLETSFARIESDQTRAHVVDLVDSIAEGQAKKRPPR